VGGTHTENITGDTKITIKQGVYEHDVAVGTAKYHVMADLTETYDATQTTTVAREITITSSSASINVTAATMEDMYERAEFARELGAEKVGLAVCVGLIREGREFARFLDRAGFQVISVACMVGGVKPQETGIPDEWVNPLGISCNPIAQAEIMNREGTELNFIYGLCVGHRVGHSLDQLSHPTGGDLGLAVARSQGGAC
jgi:uncharacterized metal-binding protein